MKDFDGNIVIEPEFRLEFVQVTHDECHFYVNDGQRRIWTLEDEDILRSKHIGRSIMVSAFVCPCHGLLRLSDDQLQTNSHIKHKETYILHSTQTDGYWKSEHMLDQLVYRALPIFEVLHPGCIGVFCFDQSTNHNAWAENALIATRMNLGPGGIQPKMRDGWYIDENNKRQIQSMVFPDNHPEEKLRGHSKGIRQVLKDRKLWPTGGIRLICDQCSRNNESKRLDCYA
ncbi:17591_t:CDS:2 [Acaulospora morrowiae]|uniref:17591_t:CDS:1 n=1 Tax=Acaulospora morrowiae TaxID=94023 RepID=A0A9N9GQD6_9GLOM|nr:17591_t:CDS:2 [Acaulospora morrowiae]